MAVRIEANDEALHLLLDGPNGPVGRELLRAAAQVATTAKRITAGPGHGRTYIRRGRVHVASAPGEPFATDTGRLRSSITSDLGVDEQGLVARVGSDVEYAPFVELGTSRMEARPFLRPALHSLTSGGPSESAA